jgi:hypothetical protein
LTASGRKDSEMRRWLASTFIAGYLLFLGWGIVSHAMRFDPITHPVMYFAVWDMFCGWQAYESRTHIVAEGESGQLYQLSPPPWNDFAPFGDLSRVHYDAFGHSYQRVGMTTLKYTNHEPIRRVLAIEECWSKKFNIPDHIWAVRFDEPKDPHSYFWLRASFDGEGNGLYAASHFTQYAYGLTIADNPRLQADAKRGRPFFAINPALRSAGSSASAPVWSGAALSSTPYGN